jgi:predicted TIM-barrel fold metal-dependent hydrolase
MPLRAYAPRSALVTPQTPTERPRFPVIDAHVHLGQLLPTASYSGDWPQRPVVELVAELDAAGVRAVVDLDGGWGEQLRRELARYREPYPERFVVFAGPDYAAFAREPDVGAFLAQQLCDSVQAGAQGLKIWKPLGLSLRDRRGRLYPVNDPRLDALWAKAGELGVPVLIHVADPVAFFAPFDRHNERWEELRWAAQYRYHGTDVPSFAALMDQFVDLVGRHPTTIFIGAHVGGYAENLRWVGAMLDANPNYYVDLGARLAELGRQPYSARDFFLAHADRILFGTDTPPDRRVYSLYYRFLETRDEYFSYSPDEIPPQGRWAIYGVDLPSDVLRRVYLENAARVLRLDPGSTTIDSPQDGERQEPAEPDVRP